MDKDNQDKKFNIEDYIYVPNGEEPTDDIEYEIRDKSRADNEVIIVKPNTLRSPSAEILSANAAKILFYAIYKIQTNQNSVSFTKKEVDETYGVDFGSYKDLKKHMKELIRFGMDISNEETGKIIFVNAFSMLTYDQGLFTFKFNQEFLPALTTQKRFLQYRMQSIIHFKSKYTIYLYDFLKDNMYKDRNIVADIGIIDFKRIFHLKPSDYEGNNTNFKLRVWKPAMEEINKYTSYQIEIKVKGRGANARYTVVRIKNEDLSKMAREKIQKKFECKLGKNRIDSKCANCMRINKCIFEIDDSAWDELPVQIWYTYEGYKYFMNQTLWGNPYYSLIDRIDAGLGKKEELGYYDCFMKDADIMERLTNGEDIKAVAASEIQKYKNEVREALLRKRNEE